MDPKYWMLCQQWLLGRKEKIPSENRVSHSREGNIKQGTEWQRQESHTRLMGRSNVVHNNQEDGSNKCIATHTYPLASWRQLGSFPGYGFKIQERGNGGSLTRFCHDWYFRKARLTC